MKAFKYLILSFVIPIGFYANAQEFVQTVRGKIVDRETQAPLPGAKIILLDSLQLKGALSDSSGNFVIEHVAIGRQSFKVAFIGYEDVYINEILISSAKEPFLNVELIESLKTLNKIEVTLEKNDPINSMATVSTRVFSIDETSRFAGSFSDPSRMAQSFPGVATAGDASNELIIRGNSSRGVLWRIEGIEVPNPNHFRSGDGSSGGGISILSSNMLANSDFMTGAFPAEYGNATSGVFDMKMRKGNSEAREFAFELGVLGTEIALEGPFSKKSKASYLINYRYSTLDLLNAVGLNLAGDIVPSYQDVSFNFFLPTKKNAGDFTLFGVLGMSKAELTADRDSSLWQSFSDRNEESNIQKMGVVGITHLYRLKSKRSYLKTVVAAIGSSNRFQQGFIDDDYVFNLNEESIFDYPALRASIYFNSKINKRNTIRTGLIFSHVGFNLLQNQYNPVIDSMLTIIDNKCNTDVLQAYAQWKRRLGEHLDLNVGAHFTQFFLNNRYSVDPRLGLLWKMKPNHSISFGAGLHSRIEPISFYLAQVNQSSTGATNPNRNLKFMKAAHAVIGYDWSLRKHLHLKTEIYYQYLFDVPIFDSISSISALNMSAGFTNMNFSNGGTGYNYGLELTLEKFFANNWFFLATSSLFQSKYIAGDGIERNTAFNSNYLTNFVIGKEFKLGKNDLLNLNARVIWKGGIRDIPIDLEQSQLEGYQVNDVSNSYANRLPDYYRIDFGVNYKINRKKYSIEIKVDIQNITNRLNVAYQFYNAETAKIETRSQFGILPVPKVKIVF